MPRVHCRDVELHYAERGSTAPPVLFVHGFACNHQDWRHQITHLGASHQVLAMDLPGHGASSLEREHASIEEMGADLNAFVQELELGPAFLVGHSMGCRVVMEAAIQAPARVRGLILVDGSWMASGDAEQSQHLARTRIEAAGFRTWITHLFEQMFFDHPEPAAPAGELHHLKTSILERALTAPEEFATELFVNFIGWDSGRMEKAVSLIEAPMLAIQSTYLNPEQERVPLKPGATTPWLDLLRAQARAVKVAIITGAGHFPMLEQPSEINRLIAEFTAA